MPTLIKVIPGISRQAIGSVAILLLLTTGCGKKTTAPPELDPAISRQLEVLQSAINTIHERYVDADQVEIDQLIRRSLKGMITSLDPHAKIFRAGEDIAGPPPPADAEPVEIKALDNDGCIALRVYRFASWDRRTLKMVEQAARSTPDASILLDVRGALGDDYAAAAIVAEWFLPAGSVIGSITEQSDQPPRALTSRRNPLWPSNTIVVLIDRETSGPAELLASALKFYNRAALAGETTRGIALVQSVVPLADEWSALLTTGRILDPDGREITGHPLTPDIVAAPDDDTAENVDWIYRQGVSALREHIGKQP